MGRIREKESKGKMMNIKSQRGNLSQAFLTLIKYFKLIGLATFTYYIVTQKNGNATTLYMFKYSELGIVYNVILIGLMTASNFVTIPDTINLQYANKSTMTVAIELFQGVFGTLVICSTLLSYCVYQKSLIRFSNRLIDVEYELDNLYSLHPSLQRQYIRRILIATCILKGCLFIILLITDHMALNSNLIQWMVDIIPTFHVGWCMMQYFLLVTIIQADFADVNRAIESFSDTNTPDSQPQSFYQIRRIVVSSSTIHQLLQLRDIHGHLCDISEEISNFFSVPILFCFAFMFLSLVYDGYYFISPLLVSTVFDLYLVVNGIFWLIFLIYPIFLLTMRVTKVSDEMKKTGLAVHRLLNCAVGNEAKLELEHFSLELLHRNIEFTANGYFSLDNTLFHSMVGATVMYLVILVQFQMASVSSTVECNCTKGNLSNTNK